VSTDAPGARTEAAKRTLRPGHGGRRYRTRTSVRSAVRHAVNEPRIVIVRARRRRGFDKADDALEGGGKHPPFTDTLQRHAKVVECDRTLELVAGSG